MKKTAVLLSALLAFGVLLTAPAQPAPQPAAAPAASTPADQDWQAYLDAPKRMPPNPQGMSRREQTEFFETMALGQQKVALAFIEKYPTDPRRWTIVNALTPTSPRFIKEYGAPDAKGALALVIDEPAAAAWKAKVTELKAAMAKATDLPLQVQESLGWGEFAAAFRVTTASKTKGEPFDYAPFHARFDAHVAKFGSLSNMPARAADYLGALEKSMPGTSSKEWRHLQAGSHEGLRKAAGEQLAKLEQQAQLKVKPLEIAFTAVDGREVDLKKLRGKVVLVDFWATWCGPCIAELPNIKKVYADYHAKGFEIVGIALENGRLLPADTADQTAEKMAKAAKVLTDFTTKESMPWPQHFDGKYWKNDISTRFGINSIPAMYLLDQEGKVVSTSARGPLLESEVKRLLKL